MNAQDDSDTDLDQHQEVTPQSSLETEVDSTLRIKSYGSSQEQKLWQLLLAMQSLRAGPRKAVTGGGTTILCRWTK